MVKIWLIPLVGRSPIFATGQAKKKRISSTHGKDFCGKKKAPDFGEYFF
jgi:hypothetical protein